jgi:hypothetical protein
MQQAGVDEVGVFANAFAIETGKQRGRRCSIETLVVVENSDSQSMPQSYKNSHPKNPDPGELQAQGKANRNDSLEEESQGHRSNRAALLKKLASLLLHQVADHGQIEYLVLVRLDYQDDPHNKSSQPYQTIAGLIRGCVPVGKIAHPRKPEHLTLKGFHNKYSPDHEQPKAGHHRDQKQKQRAYRRNEEQRVACNPQHRSNQECRQKESEALKGMKADETILAVGLNQDKQNCRQEKIGERPRECFTQHAHRAPCPFNREHAAAAARTKGGGFGHLCSAVRARDRHSFGHILDTERNRAPYQNPTRRSKPESASAPN